MAVIDSEKLLPPSKSSGNSLDSQKFLVPITNLQPKSSAIIKASDIKPGETEEQAPRIAKKSILFEVIKIKKSTIKIDKILGKRSEFVKKQQERKRKSLENESRDKKERALEGKKKKKKEGSKFPSLPGLSFLDKIGNFIFYSLLGNFFNNFGEYLPKLLEIGKVIGPVSNFLISFSGKILNATVSFIELGYNAYDKVRELTKKIGGEDAEKKFDEFSKQFNRFANIAIIAAIAASGGTDFGGGRGKGGGVQRRGFDTKGRRVTNSAQRRYFQKYGRDKFIERFGKENLKNIPKSAQRSGLTKVARGAVAKTLGRSGSKQALKLTKRFISPLVKRIPIIGAFIDFALNYFVFKEPLGRAAFKAIGTALVGVIGTALGGPIGAVIGSLLGDWAGGAVYDSFFKNKKPVTPKEDRTKDQDKIKPGRKPETPQSRKSSGVITGSQMEKWKAFYAMAEAAGAKYPQLVAAQFALESGWGQSLAAKNNFFGIKATSSESATLSSTQEVYGGKTVQTAARFKNFDTPQDAVNHLVTQWYKDYRGYRGVNNAGSAQDAADMLRSEGYATDPAYSAKLKDLMSRFADVTGTRDDISGISYSESGSNITTNIKTGSGYGSQGSKIAGELGRFIQSELRKGPDFQAVTEHPEFGGVNAVHSKNSYHYSGRAIDIGAYDYEQPPILSVIDKFGKKTGYFPVELLHAGNDRYHQDHVHVAYKSGGWVRGLTKAILGERGNEFVFDADTTAALEDKYPGLLSALNKANYTESLSLLKNYTSYYNPSMSGNTIMVQRVIVEKPISMGGRGGGGFVADSSSSNIDNNIAALSVG
jgi:flagellum-specific peptidoglycan hydrolase FlgJ